APAGPGTGQGQAGRTGPEAAAGPGVAGRRGVGPARAGRTDPAPADRARADQAPADPGPAVRTDPVAAGRRAADLAGRRSRPEQVVGTWSWKFSFKRDLGH